MGQDMSSMWVLRLVYLCLWYKEKGKQHESSVWILTRHKTPLCSCIRCHMDSNTFSSVTPINCCWHCPLEICDSALVLQTLTKEASSLLCQLWEEGMWGSHLKHCNSCSLWVEFIYLLHISLSCFIKGSLFNSLCSLMLLNCMGLILSRVYGPQDCYLPENSFPGRSYWVTAVQMKTSLEPWCIKLSLLKIGNRWLYSTEFIFSPNGFGMLVAAFLNNLLPGLWKRSIGTNSLKGL